MSTWVHFHWEHIMTTKIQLAKCYENPCNREPVRDWTPWEEDPEYLTEGLNKTIKTISEEGYV